MWNKRLLIGPLTDMQMRETSLPGTNRAPFSLSGSGRREEQPEVGGRERGV